MRNSPSDPQALMHLGSPHYYISSPRVSTFLQVYHAFYTGLKVQVLFCLGFNKPLKWQVLPLLTHRITQTELLSPRMS